MSGFSSFVERRWGLHLVILIAFCTLQPRFAKFFLTCPDFIPYCPRTLGKAVIFFPYKITVHHCSLQNGCVGPSSGWGISTDFSVYWVCSFFFNFVIIEMILEEGWGGQCNGIGFCLGLEFPLQP